jgi:hypothetical protein
MTPAASHSSIAPIWIALGLVGRAARLEWSEIVHFDDREYLKAFSAALRERQPLRARARVKRHDSACSMSLF